MTAMNDRGAPPDSSRRNFLSLSAASAVAGASASIWLPQQVNGYTAAEVLAAGEEGGGADEYAVKPGISKWELDTPALCLDLDKFEKNIASMQSALKTYGIPSRPHAKTHK